jgi:hypothetical protein
MGSRVSPIRNAGSTNGNVRIAAKVLRGFLESEPSQFAIGKPRAIAATALISAMNAVVASSSKLVVK